MFDLLPRDADDSVSQRVATNAKCPPVVLDRFASDSSTVVRRAVLERRRKDNGSSSGGALRRGTSGYPRLVREGFAGIR